MSCDFTQLSRDARQQIKSAATKTWSFRKALHFQGELAMGESKTVTKRKRHTASQPVSSQPGLKTHMRRPSTQQRGETRVPPPWLLVAGGTGLAIFSLARRSRPGAILAFTSGLAGFAATRAMRSSRGFHAEASFAINCTQEEAFQLWRDFEKLPLFMRHLESVRTESGDRSRWTLTGPMNRSVQWVAEITDESQNEYIVWSSLPGSDVRVRGSVEFSPAPGGRGTIVTATIEYRPVAGAAGRTLAAILGRSPEFALREDLRRFKAFLEAGEIPTTEGQPHGPRSAAMKALHAVYPEKRKPSEFKFAQQMQEQRRAS